MNATRLWTLGSAVVIIALIAGTWFVGVSPRLSEAATANKDRTSVEALNATHMVTLASLKKQFEEIDGLKADLEALRVAVPGDDDSAEFIRELHKYSNASGVTITELTMSAPVLFAAPAEAPADAELAAALGSVNPDNFMAIPVELTLEGAYAKVIDFVSRAQTGPRAFLVHDLVSEDGIPSGSSTVEVTITGQIFVLLDAVAPEPVGDPQSEGGPALAGNEPIVE